MYDYNDNTSGNTNYSNHNNDPFWGERKGLATASIICGVASLIAAFTTGIFGCMLGLMAVLFGIFAKGGAKIRSSKATAGAIMGAVGFLFGAFMFIYSLYFVSAHPEEFNQLQEMLQGYENFLNR